MKSKIPVALVLSIFSVAVALAQTSTNTTSTASTNGNSTPEPEAQTMVPARDNQSLVRRLVKVSGVLTDFAGKPLSGEVQVKFTLYKEETDEEPLWTETQKLGIDTRGRYTALLGATQTGGVPVELFGSDDARWLGVEVEGQPPRPRTLLVSVPYALKAVEAEKLAGKSVSDFVLSENLGEQVRQVIQAQGQVAAQSTLTGTPQQRQVGTRSTASPQVSSTGPKFPPSTFSGSTSKQIVLVHQNGTGSGLVASTPSSTGASALVGLATSTATSNSVFQNGVYGQNDGAGAGVAGIATNPSVGVGVYGQSATGFAGVFGNSVVNSGFAAGVFGTTSSPDGAGVHGANNSANGFATGVTGFSASANGNAIFGSASSTSGSANGVFGQTNSPGGSGVLGIENATTGFNSGVSGLSASANGTGVFGSSFQWVGVGGQATAPSGGPAYGVWGDSLSTGGAGVAGFEDAASGYTNGVYGQSVSPNGNGVLGVNNSNVGDFNNAVLGINNGNSGNAYGVAGQTATTGFGAGVIGTAFATSGTPFGVFGRVDSTGTGANGVFGYASASLGYTIGVSGFVESPSGTAGRFVSHSGSGLILQGISGSNFNQVFSVDAVGNLNISGNLYVAGSKSSTVQLKSGREVALYAVESPENWFEDFGTAELKSGAAWVPLDPSFAETTNATTSYHVFLTPNGDSNGLYVARKTAAGFEVREHAGGGSNVAFDYRIVVRRRGYETLRMAEVQHDVKTLESSRQHLAELANSGTLTKAVASRLAGITGARITPPPTVRPMPPRNIAPQLPRLSVPQAR